LKCFNIFLPSVDDLAKLTALVSSTSPVDYNFICVLFIHFLYIFYSSAPFSADFFVILAPDSFFFSFMTLPSLSTF
jgi:hypothetical protein